MENLMQLNPCFDFSGFTLILEIQRKGKWLILLVCKDCAWTALLGSVFLTAPEKVCSKINLFYNDGIYRKKEEREMFVNYFKQTCSHFDLPQFNAAENDADLTLIICFEEKA